MVVIDKTPNPTRTKDRYANPKALVDTIWLADHIDDPTVRVAEVDYAPSSSYIKGHIPNAFLFDWKKDINDPIKRDIFSKQRCQELLQTAGVNNDTTLVLYGDFNNMFAAFVFWALKYYGYKDVRLLNGGRKKRIEEGRPLTSDVPVYRSGNFIALDPDEKIRALLSYVRQSLNNEDEVLLLDTRSPKEFTGELLAPLENQVELPQRGGHIPGAINIPWDSVVNSDGIFKSAKELEQIYQAKGILPDKEIIAYCRFGARSSHTWFVLKYLLGYPSVRNYDGSWTEWGNMIGNPIEK